jgi:AraC-like DNA-binding protein
MHYGRFSTTDTSELELALRPWDVCLNSRGGTNQRFELEYFNAPGLTVARESYATGVRLVGMPPSGQLILVIPVDCDRETSFCGVKATDHQLYAASGEALEARYAEATTLLSIQIDLEQEISPTLKPLVEKLATCGRRFEIAESLEDVTRLSRAINQLFRFHQFYADGAADFHPARGQALLGTLEDALSRVVVPEWKDVGASSSPAKVAAVSTVLEYLRTPGVERVSVSELCSATGVNERMLQRGVREQFDCTVVQLLRNYRLHAARRRLLVAGPTEATVSDIAVALGFRDFGRFAEAYRNRFDEYPSTTLAGPSKSIAPRLGTI